MTSLALASVDGRGEMIGRGGAERGWVSVWVGDLTNELDLDGYLGAPFAADHGCKLSGQGEYTVQPAAMPLKELLARFSLADRWLASVLDTAQARGVHAASCAVVEQHYRYDAAGPGQGPLRFLASVRWG